MPNQQDITLQTKNLSIGYFHKNGNHIVAKNINFFSNKSELIGLVGSNGIGKSTLLRTLCKVQNALSGEIFINNQNLKSYTYETLAETLSVVLTETPASKNMTVAELVALGRQPYTNWLGTITENDKTHITQALEATEMMSFKDRKCYELSDGQLQRALIARALAQDTPIIILDEPTTHLDLYHRASILKLLKNLTKTTGKTILFSTHEIDLAIQLCDKMLVMTPEECYFGDPCQLIEAGHFSKLFPKNLIDFDVEVGRFKIIN
ncbi:ABC transporter ATP-binding protein [Paucihalobacter ruber]|uniref:ABC transporter ATP-binding protein n=1 Tax=Paucihalobacter ruber TaxID=2567861 RepID=A0A506PJU0_9FLAO|nr:ABC transporter ATP-binding protein [Paucihalobacter ruber]TPV33778.1 ABC transporter ATP-binding protein [Paucihalobacter ruber]